MRSSLVFLPTQTIPAFYDPYLDDAVNLRFIEAPWPIYFLNHLPWMPLGGTQSSPGPPAEDLYQHAEAWRCSSLTHFEDTALPEVATSPQPDAQGQQAEI